MHGLKHTHALMGTLSLFPHTHSPLTCEYTYTLTVTDAHIPETPRLSTKAGPWWSSHSEFLPLLRGHWTEHVPSRSWQFPVFNSVTGLLNAANLVSNIYEAFFALFCKADLPTQFVNSQFPSRSDEPVVSQVLSGIPKMQSGHLKTWYISCFRAQVTFPESPARGASGGPDRVWLVFSFLSPSASHRCGWDEGGGGLRERRIHLD